MKHAQRAQQPRAIAAEPAIQVFLRVLEVAKKHAEPDDARRIGVGPHHAQIDVMEERHGGDLDARRPSVKRLPRGRRNLSRADID